MTINLSKLTKSLELQERAKKRIPGMTQLLSKRPDMFSMGVWPGYYSKAKGASVWDADGNKYLDMSIGGIGANVLGYADCDVDAAVTEAIKNGSSSSLNCPEEIILADLLCELHPWAQMCRFTRSGGEAMTMAVRIARAHTGKDTVAFCGYHGWHDWYLAANVGTENALGEHLISGLKPAGVPQGLKGTALPFKFNRLEELEKIVRDNKGKLAAVVMEPIRSEPPAQIFVKGVKALADEANAPLIIDEISSGFRLNNGGAHLLYGYEPDIAVFSKAMGNGYPIGAVIGRAQVMEAAQNTFISSTCWTERTGPTAAIATIKKFIAHDVSAHLCRMGQLIQDGWRTLCAKHDIKAHISGILPMSHIDFELHPQQSKALYVQEMLAKNILASNLFYAMYSHTQDDAAKYLEASDEAFAAIKKAQDADYFALQGEPSSMGFKRLT